VGSFKNLPDPILEKQLSNWHLEIATA